MKCKKLYYKPASKPLSVSTSLSAAISHTAARILPAAMSLLAAPLLLGGCALSENGGRLALEELGGQEDRLAGVFVTRDYIEPGSPSLELDSRGEIVVKNTESEKIYGSFTGYDAGTAIVSFPNLEGCGIYALTAPGEESQGTAGNKYNISDLPFANVHYNVSDQEEGVEADLHVSTGSFAKYYFNPVYQQEDGQIYLLAGSGMSSDSFTDGAEFGYSISESVTHTENGEQSAHTLRFTVNIIGSGLPQETELLVMDEENRLLKRYDEEQLQKFSDTDTSLALSKEASYLILRQTIAGKEHDSRSLFDQNAEYVEYMAPAENGYLYFRQLPLAWP